MANAVLVTVGTQIRFCVTASYSPTDPGTDFTIGTPTDVALTLSAIASAAGRQSLKVDLGATRAPLYDVMAAIDFTGETPTVGLSVDLYWAPSTSTTQGTGNVAGNSGGDAGCPDGALGSITLAEFVKQCVYIGSLIVHDGAVVQNGYVGSFASPTRYGQMIVVNSSGDAFEASNVEMAVFMTPNIPEIQ